MYTENDWWCYLAHHGIKNQEWGVQNGPPYPLDTSEHNRIIAGVDDSKRRMRIKNETEGWIKRFTQKDEKKYFQQNPVEQIDNMRKIQDGSDIHKIRYGINHGGTDAGRHYNCPNCAAAFDMVERGYDVIARPKANGSNVGDIEKLFVGSKLDHVGKEELDPEVYKAYKKYGSKTDVGRLTKYDKLWYEEAGRTEAALMNQLRSQKVGERGIVVVGWRENEDPSERTTLFHAINYKIEKDGPTFYDTQSRHDYDGYKDSLWIIEDCDPREVFMMKTTDLEPSSNIGRFVHSRR